MQYEEGLTVKKMLLKLKLNPGVVGLIVINGKVTQHNNELSRGDNIEIYPIFGGG
ncbi:MAG: MoaD/ThiS family protein [Eubacteriales bacterium]